jgi:hypothetical protein
MSVAPRPSGTAATCSAQEEVPLSRSPAHDSSSQLNQSVAALAGGSFGTVWWENEWPQRDVRLQLLDASGRPLLEPGGRLIAHEAGDEADPVIVARPSSGAYVAFVRDTTVVVQSFDGEGHSRWPGDGVPAGIPGPDDNFMHPNLVANPAGGVFVCFQVFNFVFQNDIRCQSIDDGGALRWGSLGAGVASSPSAELRVVPRAVSDGAGGILVFWRNQRSLSSPAGPMLMEGQRFGPDGQKPWGPEPKVIRTTRLAADGGHSFTFFNAVSDGSGGAVVAFNDWINLGDPALDVLTQRVSANGDLLWGEGATVSGAIGHQQHDQTIAAGDGGAFVAVYESLSSTRSRLLLHRLGPNGTHVWPAEGMSLPDPGALAVDYNVFGSFDDGMLRVAWTHQKFPASFEFDVQYATFDSSGARTGGTFLTEAPDAQVLRGLAYSVEFGGIVAMWEERAADITAGFLKEAIACPVGDFHTLTPCRLLDTRNTGGAPLFSRQSRTYAAVGACGIPPSATAIAVNVTVVSPSAAGYLTLYPAGHPRPLASTVNFGPGQTRGNNALLGLSLAGAFAVYPQLGAAGTTHLVVDVTGYFN